MGWDRAYRNAQQNPDVDFDEGVPAVVEPRRPPQAKHVELDGIKFDSQEEAQRHQVLRMWVLSGLIADLQVKPLFVLQEEFIHPSVGKIPAVTWRADWQYRQLLEPYCTVIEDYKGGYLHRSFRVRRPFILGALATRHVFFNQDMHGWYEPLTK